MPDSTLIQFEVTDDGNLELLIPGHIWDILKEAATAEPPLEPTPDGTIRISAGQGNLRIDSTPSASQPTGGAGGILLVGIPPTLQPGCQATLIVVTP